MPSTSQSPLGLAFIGLGKYTTKQLVPALAACPSLRLAGAMSGELAKAQAFLRDHGGPAQAAYTYDDFDALAQNPDIHVVYVVTPNSTHEDLVTRAAQAGKHVICEKPLGITRQECERMIAACQQAGVLLGVGYRMHFEPLTRELVQRLRSGAYGRITRIEAAFSDDGKEAGEWRLDAELSGGGPLMDMGIYAVNAACYVTGQDPVAVGAVEGPQLEAERFGDPDVEQQISWEMHFADGVVARCRTSYAASEDYLRVYTERGTLLLSPAFNYQAQHLTLPDGQVLPRPAGREQSYQLEDFAQCVLQGQPTPVPGELGLRDVLLMETIYEAADLGEVLPVPYPAGWQPIGERFSGRPLPTITTDDASGDEATDYQQAA